MAILTPAFAAMSYIVEANGELIYMVKYTEAFQRLCELRRSNNIEQDQLFCSVVTRSYLIKVMRLLLTKLPASKRYK